MKGWPSNWSALNPALNRRLSAPFLRSPWLVLSNPTGTTLRKWLSRNSKSISKMVPILRARCEGWETTPLAQSDFGLNCGRQWEHDGSHGGDSIVSHPCKSARMGHPLSVTGSGAEVGHPPPQLSPSEHERMCGTALI